MFFEKSQERKHNPNQLMSEVDGIIDSLIKSSQPPTEVTLSSWLLTKIVLADAFQAKKKPKLAQTFAENLKSLVSQFTPSGLQPALLEQLDSDISTLYDSLQTGGGSAQQDLSHLNRLFTVLLEHSEGDTFSHPWRFKLNTDLAFRRIFGTPTRRKILQVGAAAGLSSIPLIAALHSGADAGLIRSEEGLAVARLFETRDQRKYQLEPPDSEQFIQLSDTLASWASPQDSPLFPQQRAMWQTWFKQRFGTYAFMNFANNLATVDHDLYAQHDGNLYKLMQEWFIPKLEQITEDLKLDPTSFTEFIYYGGKALSVDPGMREDLTSLRKQILFGAADTAQLRLLQSNPLSDIIHWAGYHLSDPFTEKESLWEDTDIGTYIGIRALAESVGLFGIEPEVISRGIQLMKRDFPNVYGSVFTQSRELCTTSDLLTAERDSIEHSKQKIRNSVVAYCKSVPFDTQEDFWSPIFSDSQHPFWRDCGFSKDSPNVFSKLHEVTNYTHAWFNTLSDSQDLSSEKISIAVEQGSHAFDYVFYNEDKKLGLAMFILEHLSNPVFREQLLKFVQFDLSQVKAVEQILTDFDALTMAQVPFNDALAGFTFRFMQNQFNPALFFSLAGGTYKYLESLTDNKDTFPSLTRLKKDPYGRLFCGMSLREVAPPWGGLVATHLDNTLRLRNVDMPVLDTVHTPSALESAFNATLDFLDRANHEFGLDLTETDICRLAVTIVSYKIESSLYPGFHDPMLFMYFGPAKFNIDYNVWTTNELRPHIDKLTGKYGWSGPRGAGICFIDHQIRLNFQTDEFVGW